MGSSASRKLLLQTQPVVWHQPKAPHPFPGRSGAGEGWVRSPAGWESFARAGRKAEKGLGGQASADLSPSGRWVGVPQLPLTLFTAGKLSHRRGHRARWLSPAGSQFAGSSPTKRSGCGVELLRRWVFLIAARAPRGDVGFGHRRPALGAGGVETPRQERSPRSPGTHRRSAAGDTNVIIRANIHLSGYGQVLTPRRTVAKSKMVCRTPASGCHGYHVKLSSGTSYGQSYRNST